MHSRLERESIFSRRQHTGSALELNCFDLIDICSHRTVDTVLFLSDNFKISSFFSKKNAEGLKLKYHSWTRISSPGFTDSKGVSQQGFQVPVSTVLKVFHSKDFKSLLQKLYYSFPTLCFRSSRSRFRFFSSKTNLSMALVASRMISSADLSELIVLEIEAADNGDNVLILSMISL